MAIQALFFDLDGTLTDPKIGITRSFQYALEKLGETVPSVEDLLWCIGPPLRESFAQLLRAHDDALLHAAVSHYRERYAAVGKFENAVYDAIPDALQRLQTRGIALYVATSKLRGFAVEILEHFQLAPYFQEIFGSDADGRHADKRELLAHALSAARLDAACCGMVGDRKFDMIGAAANGVCGIGVTYGYGSRDELLNAGARHIADAPGDICHILTQMTS